MRILSIGNSFSVDAHAYLHRLAAANGEMLDTVNLYIPSCTLSIHYRNMLSENRAYDLQVNGVSTKLSVSLAEVLSEGEYDVVTLQQVSYLTPDPSSFEPYFSALADYVRRYQPKAKIFLHSGWQYRDGAEILTRYGFADGEDMYAKIKNAVGEVMKVHAASIDGLLPTHEAVHGAVASGAAIHRDDLHLSIGVGRYLLALTWYMCLIGKKPCHIPMSDFDAPMTDGELALALKCAEAAAASL